MVTYHATDLHGKVTEKASLSFFVEKQPLELDKAPQELPLTNGKQSKRQRNFSLVVPPISPKLAINEHIRLLFLFVTANFSQQKCLHIP